MTTRTGKVVLVMPAYFAERTLESVYSKIPKQCVDEIILVDDASADNIEAVANSFGIRFFKNKVNLGYGGNIKTCLQKAMDSMAEVIIELHPDDQYDPGAIPDALKKIEDGYDLVMGSRFLTPGAALKFKMPFWKYAINRFSTLLIDAVLGARLTEFHSGFRIYRRRLVESVNFLRNDNDYTFSFQIIAQACFSGFRIAEVPITCRYYEGVTQIDFRNTFIYGLGVLKTLGLFLLAKCGMRYPVFRLNATST